MILIQFVLLKYACFGGVASKYFVLIAMVDVFEVKVMSQLSVLQHLIELSSTNLFIDFIVVSFQLVGHRYVKFN